MSPAGIDVLPDGLLLVADTNHHRVVTVDRTQRVRSPRSGSATTAPAGLTAGASLSGAAGSTIVLQADVDLAGKDLDVSQGPPVRVHLTTDSETLLGAGPRSWALDSLPVRVEVQLG